MKGQIVTAIFMISVMLAPAVLAADFGATEAVYREPVQNCAEEQAEEPIRLIIRNLQGVELGEIVNFLVDPEVGVVAYALVDTGNALELEDLRLVPVHALTVENQAILLDMDERELANAPIPSPEQEPEEFHRQLSDYYGVAPYWEE